MQLFVVFKGPDEKGEVAEYLYNFSTPAQGQAIFDRMRVNAHPYGNVLYPDVIQGGIPYKCLFK